MDRSTQPQNPNTTRLTPLQWDLVLAAEQHAVGQGGKGGGDGGGDGSDMMSLKGLCDSVKSEWDKWVTWADEGDVWDASRIPGDFFAEEEGDGGTGGATLFQRLLLVKAFREDQLLRCIAKFVGKKLGSNFAERYGTETHDSETYFLVVFLPVNGGLPPASVPTKSPLRWKAKIRSLINLRRHNKVVFLVL